MAVKALVILIAGFVLMGSAEAASPVAGGLPVVTTRVTALEALTKTLQSVISTLQGQVGSLQSQVGTLQSQVTTLQNSNSDLRDALNDEMVKRAISDASLSGKIDQEIAARKAADAALQAGAGSKAYSTFKFESDLVNGAEATVGSIGPLPAGNYVVIATASVMNTDHDSDWYCKLIRDDNSAVIGHASVPTEEAPSPPTGKRTA